MGWLLTVDRLIVPHHVTHHKSLNPIQHKPGKYIQPALNSISLIYKLHPKSYSIGVGWWYVLLMAVDWRRRRWLVCRWQVELVSRWVQHWCGSMMLCLCTVCWANWMPDGSSDDADSGEDRECSLGEVCGWWVQSCRRREGNCNARDWE